MHLSRFITFKYFLVVSSLISLCCISFSHARPRTSKTSVRPKTSLQSYRVVVVNCQDRYVKVKGPSCQTKKVGISQTNCRKVKLGDQVFLNKRKNMVKSVFGAYRSWGGTIKVLNSQDRYLKIKSCEAECKIGATSDMMRNFRVGQKANATLNGKLTWNGSRCTGTAKSLRRL